MEKIKVTISKTIQERQYEPFAVSLEAEVNVSGKSDKQVMKRLAEVEEMLEYKVGDIIDDRLECLEKNNG